MTEGPEWINDDGWWLPKSKTVSVAVSGGPHPRPVKLVVHFAGSRAIHERLFSVFHAVVIALPQDITVDWLTTSLKSELVIYVTDIHFEL